MVNPDLWKALEASNESLMGTWCLGWDMTVLSHYLYNKCKGDSILGAVSSKLHSATQESRQTSAQGASVATAAQRHMASDASPFKILGFLATPYIGNSLFGGHFHKAAENATHSLEQSSQVKRLATSGLRVVSKLPASN